MTASCKCSCVGLKSYLQILALENGTRMKEVSVTEAAMFMRWGQRLSMEQFSRWIFSNNCSLGFGKSYYLQTTLRLTGLIVRASGFWGSGFTLFFPFALHLLQCFCWVTALQPWHTPKLLLSVYSYQSFLNLMLCVASMSLSLFILLLLCNLNPFCLPLFQISVAPFCLFLFFSLFKHCSRWLMKISGS